MLLSIMKKKYPVILSETEREELKGLIAAGSAPARKLTHARILLKADQSPQGPGWVDEKVADAVETSQPTPFPGYASSTSRKACRQLSTGAHPTGSTTESSMVSRRRGFSRLPVVSHPKVKLAGVCGFWPTSWLSLRSWRRRSPTRRSEGL
jgi:hypothetical protein